MDSKHFRHFQRSQHYYYYYYFSLLILLWNVLCLVDAQGTVTTTPAPTNSNNNSTKNNSTQTDATDGNGAFCLDCAFDFKWAFPSMERKASGMIIVGIGLFFCCFVVSLTTCLVCYCKHQTPPGQSKYSILKTDGNVA